MKIKITFETKYITPSTIYKEHNSHQLKNIIFTLKNIISDTIDFSFFRLNLALLSIPNKFQNITDVANTLHIDVINLRNTFGPVYKSFKTTPQTLPN